MTGKEREEAGQLQGRVEKRAILWWNVDHGTNDRTKVEWVVEAKAGERVGAGRTPRACGNRYAPSSPLT